MQNTKDEPMMDCERPKQALAPHHEPDGKEESQRRETVSSGTSTSQDERDALQRRHKFSGIMIEKSS